MDMSKNSFALSCATVLSLSAILVPTGAARRQTTEPGVVYIVKVVLTDKKISIARDKFTTKTGVTRYPRGAIIRYAITNKGKRPYAWRVWGADTPVMKPGGHESILVNWHYRGTYSYELLFRGKPVGPRGQIIIF
jgi:hypothetical protein